MSCMAGLNQFLSVNVPAINGEGLVLDVSGLVARKTFYLSGPFDGKYIIMGTHDDVHYVPILSFDGSEIPKPNESFAPAPAGPFTIRRDVEATLKSIKVQRAANKTVNISLASQATCACE